MKINYRRRRQSLSKETKLRIATDYNAKMSLKEIMARYNISKQTIYDVLNWAVKEEVK